MIQFSARNSILRIMDRFNSMQGQTN